jgi:4-amino-4-deoxy-L-arabinose transferase-like glycosyltransferase
MYLALAAGTLAKGLIGLILPGMVFFFYLLFAKKWSALKKMYLFPGVLIYISLVVPWYLWIEQRNPGYLQYYFWDEHFTRYLTEEFDRSKAWYYFLLVLGVGFLPWSFILPLSIKNLIKDFDDKYLFLTLWVCLPLLFFSFSKSQLPQYILPVFPALALITGRAVGESVERATVQRLRWLYPLFFVFGILACYFTAGTISAQLLPEQIRASVGQNSWFILSCTVLLLIPCVALPFANMKGYWKSQPAVYLCSCAVCAIFFVLMGQLMTGAAPHRSSKRLAQSSASYITPASRVVFYETYLTGLIYYLSLPQPIWLVAREGKKNLLGSPYVSRYFPAPPAGYGKVFLDFDEFGKAWKESEVPVMVFLKAKNLSRFEGQLGMTVKELVRVNEYILVARR